MLMIPKQVIPSFHSDIINWRRLSFLIRQSGQNFSTVLIFLQNLLLDLLIFIYFLVLILLISVLYYFLILSFILSSFFQFQNGSFRIDLRFFVFSNISIRSIALNFPPRNALAASFKYHFYFQSSKYFVIFLVNAFLFRS